MVVKIRLARFGKRHAPFYNIVVAHARTARNSLPLEVLGTYDPIPRIPIGGEGRKYKDLRLDTSRAKYWLGVGAQPSDPAWRLLSMVGLVTPRFVEGRKQVPRVVGETSERGSAEDGIVGVEGEEPGEVRLQESAGEVEVLEVQAEDEVLAETTPVEKATTA